MRRTALVVGVLLAIVAYGVADVRQRARIDRGTRRHRTDLTVYLAASGALVHGGNPYEARNPRGYRYVYPPLLAILMMPFADWNPANAALVFFAVSVAALALSIRALARVRAPPVGMRAALAGALLCLPFLHQSFERGQVTILLLGLQVGALAMLLRKRPLAAGVLLAVGGALRLTPLLPAGAAFLGALAGIRAHGLRPPAALAGGVLAGLLLCFVVLPVGVLGPKRAEETHRQWLAATASVFGDLEDLQEDYAINEYRFKNQAPRRVFSTWAGWATGAAFEREKPALGEGVSGGVDLAAFGVTVLVALLAAGLGWRRLRDPGATGYAATFAVLMLLPVLMTRYTWPTHFVMALPAMALAVACRRRVAWAAFAAGTILFYAAHAKALEPVGAAGPLLLATVVFLARFTPETRTGAIAAG